MDLLNDLALLLDCVKYLGYMLILWLCTLAFSGCGVSAGGFVAGTTGYLKEHNQGRILSPEHTQSERRRLARVINGGD